MWLRREVDVTTPQRIRFRRGRFFRQRRFWQFLPRMKARLISEKAIISKCCWMA
jgi:hypothetical protein